MSALLFRLMTTDLRRTNCRVYNRRFLVKTPFRGLLLDVKRIIDFFGGVRRLREALENEGINISIGGIEKWRERGNIPSRVLILLGDIDTKFNLQKFRNKKGEE